MGPKCHASPIGLPQMTKFIENRYRLVATTKNKKSLRAADSNHVKDDLHVFRPLTIRDCPRSEPI